MNIFCLIIGVLVFLGCFFCGKNISITEQLPIYESLRNTSAIIFGVMGAWIAILYPNALLKIYGKTDLVEAEKGSKSIKQLISPMVLSTFIVSFVLLISLIAPIVRGIPSLVAHKNIIRSLSFALLGLLTFSQLWALIATLLPSEMVKRSVEFTINKRKKVEQKFPNISK
jgi:hypothetical protein